MLLDTGILVELMSRPRSDKFVKSLLTLIADDPIFISSLQYGELADVFRRDGLSFGNARRRLERFTTEIPVDQELALEASTLKAQARAHKAGRKFSLIDGVILASARSRTQRLVTLDPDFIPFEDVLVLERP